MIDAIELSVGEGTVIHESATIGGKPGSAKRVVIGENCYIGAGVTILTPEFELGDYSKVHAYTYGHGEGALKIGRCCWIGGNVVLDAMGGLTLKDGVGVGSGTQVWSHVQFGDIVQGCRLWQRRQVTIHEDAWLIGHCLVAAAYIGTRSMAMLGSVVTRDMMDDHTYSGSPAVDVTEQMGRQFMDFTPEDKRKMLAKVIQGFERDYPQFTGEIKMEKFDVTERTYKRDRSPAEVAFMKMWVPLVKFYPEVQC